MKILSVRDLRQRWPQAQALLRVEHEIIITRDSKPVASGGHVSRWVDRTLAEARDDTS